MIVGLEQTYHTETRHKSCSVTLDPYRYFGMPTVPCQSLRGKSAPLPASTLFSAGNKAIHRQPTEWNLDAGQVGNDFSLAWRNCLSSWYVSDMMSKMYRNDEENTLMIFFHCNSLSYLGATLEFSKRFSEIRIEMESQRFLPDYNIIIQTGVVS